MIVRVAIAAALRPFASTGGVKWKRRRAMAQDLVSRAAEPLDRSTTQLATMPSVPTSLPIETVPRSRARMAARG